jgi:hypothetical protein
LFGCRGSRVRGLKGCGSLPRRVGRRPGPASGQRARPSSLALPCARARRARWPGCRGAPSSPAVPRVHVTNAAQLWNCSSDDGAAAANLAGEATHAVEERGPADGELRLPLHLLDLPLGAQHGLRMRAAASAADGTWMRCNQGEPARTRVVLFGKGEEGVPFRPSLLWLRHTCLPKAQSTMDAYASHDIEP